MPSTGYGLMSAFTGLHMSPAGSKQLFHEWAERNGLVEEGVDPNDPEGYLTKLGETSALSVITPGDVILGQT